MTFPETRHSLIVQLKCDDNAPLQNRTGNRAVFEKPWRAWLAGAMGQELWSLRHGHQSA